MYIYTYVRVYITYLLKVPEWSPIIAVIQGRGGEPLLVQGEEGEHLLVQGEEGGQLLVHEGKQLILQCLQREQLLVKGKVKMKCNWYK